MFAAPLFPHHAGFVTGWTPGCWWTALALVADWRVARSGATPLEGSSCKMGATRPSPVAPSATTTRGQRPACTSSLARAETRRSGRTASSRATPGGTSCGSPRRPPLPRPPLQRPLTLRARRRGRRRGDGEASPLPRSPRAPRLVHALA